MEMRQQYHVESQRTQSRGEGRAGSTNAPRALRGARQAMTGHSARPQAPISQRSPCSLNKEQKKKSGPCSLSVPANARQPQIIYIYTQQASSQKAGPPYGGHRGRKKNYS